MGKCTPTRRHQCVQLLEGTAAVLSLRKICEVHGYSYEWVSGQKPQLTKHGKSIICKTEKFRTSLSANSGSNSHPQAEEKQNKPLRTELLRIHLQVQYLSEVTNKPPEDWAWNP